MRRQRDIKLAVSIFMAIAIALFLPGLGITGSLEPSDPPGPTMKTLDQIPPTWSQKLQCDTTACPRFQLVLDGTGVLDKETGLVWEQSPDNTNVYNWETAQTHCNRLTKGGRLGWRIPTVQELLSLVDPSVYPGPTLPSGHPFSNVRDDIYWSATTAANDTSKAWTVGFGGGLVTGPWCNNSESSCVIYVWCVRGGQVVDAQ